MPGATVAGIILGTAAYMAPEQAKGRPADRRSDLWAFGCVLFEMLTGRPVFTGEDVSEILAEVIKCARRLGTAAARHASIRAPTAAALPREGPEGPHRGRGRGAAGDRRRRSGRWTATRRPRAVPASWGPSRLYPAAAGLLLGALGVGAVAFGTQPADTDDVLQPTRFSLSLPAGVQLVNNASQRLSLAPDGRRLFYTRGVRRRGATLRPPPGPVGPRSRPRIRRATWGACSRRRTASGSATTTLVPGKFKKIPATGSPPATICDVPAATGGFAGASWGSGGTIVFAVANVAGLMRVPEAGGVPQDVDHAQGRAAPAAVFPARWPRSLLFTIVKSGQPSQVAVLRLADGT